MNQLSIKMKLAGSFGLVIVILIFMGIYSIYSLGNVNEKSTEMAEDWLPGIASVSKIKDSVDLIRIYEYKHVVETDVAKMKKIEDDKSKAAQEIENGIASYRKLIHESSAGNQDVINKDKQMIDDLEEAWREYEKMDERIIALSAAERQPEAMVLINGESIQSYEHLSEHTNALVDYNHQNAKLASDEGDVIYANAGKITTIMIALAVLLSVGIAYWMIRMLSKPVNELMRVSTEAAKGNLGVRAEVYSQDELGLLSGAYNETLTAMAQLIAQIQNTSEQVAAASEELTASAEQSAMVSQQVAQNISAVSAASTQQLNSVDAASGTIEQMSIGIGHAATGANDSAQHAAGAVDKAKEGGMAIEKAVVQMNNIEITVNRSAEVVTKLGERSKEIGQIVETISGIAGQTNLLALNAAIEAARAGEQGRGFAVVAEEVRKLAEQSQEAAERISSLIANIQKETEEAVQAMNEGTEEVKLGAAVVNDGGKAFQELADMAVSISRQVQDISASMQELSSGTDHIVSSVKDVDEASRNIASESQTVAAATEEQSASMEEIASSSRNLAQLAQNLQEATQRFSL